MTGTSMTGAWLIQAALMGVVFAWPLPCSAQSPPDEAFSELQADAKTLFSKQVAPFINKYCIECHSNKRPTEAGVNFSPALNNPSHAAFSQQWKNAVARVKAHDMPPDSAEHTPTQAERQMFVDWLGEIKYLSQKDPGPFIIRRLTKTEYGNTLHDLLGVDASIAAQLPDEVSGEGYLNSLSSLQLEHYLAIAELVLDEVLPLDHLPTPQVQAILGEMPGAESEPHSTPRKTARSLARKAYRRPPTEAEVDVLVKVYDLGMQHHQDAAQALRLMFKAALVSPQFLFITPAGSLPPDGEIVAVDDYQLASRLSYFLWSTMPDQTLLKLAEEGRLHEPAELRTQTHRMLADPRCRALFDGFGVQWLGLGELQHKEFDPSKYPQMTAQLRAAMVDEARLFFASLLRDNSSVVRFIDSDYTYLNDSLATLYGMQDLVVGSEMRRVQLQDDNRGGILAMPAILAATSFPNRTSAVKRGVWVLEQVLGDTVPPAPPDVPALDSQDPQTIAELTLRERTELHRTNPVCANCHQILDPIGFGLENFDALGRWRERDDNGAVIDASGELPGGLRFSSPGELKAIFADQADKLTRNFLEKLLAYALCRKLEGYDEIVVDQLMEELSADGYRLQTLVSAVVTSYPFTHRRLREELELP